MSGPTDLLDRARVLEDAGDYAGVADLLETAAEGALVAEPELGYRLAYALRRTGRSRKALALVSRLHAPVQRRGDERLTRRLLSLRAMLFYDLGDVGQAEALWERLAGEAYEAGDFKLMAAAANNLGVVRTLQDRTEEAVAAYTRALLASRRLGDRRGLAQAHQNLAILFRELGMNRESNAHFHRAIENARASSSDDVLGRAEEETGLLFLEQGDIPLAVAWARRALHRLRSLRDAAGEGEALRVLGLAALRGGDRKEARRELRRALEQGRTAGNTLLEAETLEALAVLARIEGNDRAATKHENGAAQLFESMGAAPWGLRIRSRTAALVGL